jgi:hypothetical protein
MGVHPAAAGGAAVVVGSAVVSGTVVGASVIGGASVVVVAGTTDVLDDGAVLVTPSTDLLEEHPAASENMATTLTSTTAPRNLCRIMGGR